MFRKTLRAVLTAGILSVVTVGASSLEAKNNNDVVADTYTDELVKSIKDKKVNYFYISSVGDQCGYIDSTRHIRNRLLESFEIGNLKRSHFIEVLANPNNKNYNIAITKNDYGIGPFFIFSDTLENCRIGIKEFKNINNKEAIKNKNESIAQLDTTPVSEISLDTIYLIKSNFSGKYKEIALMSALNFMNIVKKEKDIPGGSLINSMTYILNKSKWEFDTEKDICTYIKDDKAYKEKLLHTKPLIKTMEFVFGNSNKDNLKGTFENLIFQDLNGDQEIFILTKTKQDCVKAGLVYNLSMFLGAVIPNPEDINFFK